MSADKNRRSPWGAARRSGRGAKNSEDSPRAHAKALLREAGAALEQGDIAVGRARLEQALAADPTFVEPALALSAHGAGHDDVVLAMAMAEEAVRRGQAMVERIPRKEGGPAWWLDEATRPCMKARVARATRHCEAGQLEKAAIEFESVMRLEPEDPLGAGALAAEARARLGQWSEALRLYSETPESPAVAYGRALALLETGRAAEALVALWTAVLVDSFVARELCGEEAFSGIDPKTLVGDAGEAREYASRAGFLWTTPALTVLVALLGDQSFRADLETWVRLARTLDDAADGVQATTALADIESFLGPERIAAEAAAFHSRLTNDEPDADPARRGRLPVVR